jgi:hypothetical protein
MLSLPRDLLVRLAALPPGVPCRILLHTNGHGEWKTEITLCEGACHGEPVPIFPDVAHDVVPPLTAGAQ